jgi:hypothetical protein
MFKCQNCGVNTQPNQPVNKVIINKRDKEYLNIIENKLRRQTREINSDGWEIAKEIKVCPKCFTELTGREARIAVVKEVEIVKEVKPRDDRKFEQKKKPIVEVVNPLKKK